MIYLLSAKVPDIDTEVFISRQREFPLNDIDTFGGWLILFEHIVVVFNLLSQGSLACPGFTHDKQLSLVQVILFSTFKLTKVIFDPYKIGSAFIIKNNFRRRSFDGIILQNE